MSGTQPESCNILDTAPPHHVYTGGLLRNLQEPAAPRTPDYLCGELTWDGAVQALNWYHHDGGSWRRTVISSGLACAVGMDAADLTGDGRADVVVAEWPLGDRKDAADGGGLDWLEQPGDPFHEPWPRHRIAAGWGKAHDLHVGDIEGAGNPDVLVRLKDGRISWFARPAEPRDAWRETRVAEAQAGDGTALYDVTGNGALDVVTGAGFYESSGDGSAWTFRPFAAARQLQLDPETRVAVGDVAGDGSVTVFISESEVLERARLVALHSDDGGATWDARVLIDGERGLGALHSLQLVDVDDDGRLDLFTAEMEYYLKDGAVRRRPRWLLLHNRGGLAFEEHTVLDARLGAHQGFAGRLGDAGRVDFVAKNWSPQADNACGGLNHVVHVSRSLGELLG